MNNLQIYRRCLIVLFVMNIIWLPSQAQTKNEFGIWGGGSFHSSTIIGATEDAKLGLISLRYTRSLIEKNNLSLKYTVDVLPAVILNYPEYSFAFGGGTTPIAFLRVTQQTVYGAGLAPLGLQFNLRPKKKIQPFISTNGGFIYFSKSIPNSAGKQFNFTAELGGGAQIFTSTNKAVTLGYKYHHLSNAYRGTVNPGFDANVIYIGVSVFK